ncbi:MAG: ABC transporter permease, partial [Clostridiales bacterium]|nr:ABC transporter permease [Clostridiales bacterium]
EKNLERQFNASNLADLWIEGELSTHAVEQIKQISGVTDAQRRTYIRGSVSSLPGDPDIDLYTNENSFLINKPISNEKIDLNEYTNKNVCILNESFAKAFHLETGNMITVTIGGNALELYIAGIGHSSEYTLYNDGVDFRADPSTFGYAFLSPGTLNFFPFNQTLVTIDPTADDSMVKEAIITLLDDSSKKISLRMDDLNLKLSIEEVEQIRALGSVFPIVFFLVAALITWSTMKRLVDKQRAQIGVMMSMGYTKKALNFHYISFGLLISFISSLLGILAGYFIIGNIVLQFLNTFYVLPNSRPYLDIGIALLAFVLILLITSGACYLSSVNALKENPASLLRPKSPPPGKRILLERFTFLWKRFSYNQKLILRNMFLNKTRMLIGIIGIVGCVALLITGFGMRDSVAYVLDHYYEDTLLFDARVTLDQYVTKDYLQAIALRANATHSESMMVLRCDLDSSKGSAREDVYVLEDKQQLMLIEDASRNRIDLPSYGVAVTLSQAEKYHLSIGDTVTVQIGNYQKKSLPVTEIISMDLGQGLYMSASYWRTLELGDYIPSALMLKGSHLSLTQIEDMEGILKVRSTDEERASSGKMVEVLNLVVLIFVFFAGSLDIVVLYTLAQLNFYERQRELATLMVLGYYPKENKKLILRENIIISIIAIPVGLV